MSSQILSGVALIAAALTGLCWAISRQDRDPATGEDPTGGRPAVGTVAVERVRVASVVDGDTLRVAAPAGTELGRVRLLGVNAREVDHGHGGEQCCGAIATSLLRRLTPVGSTVTLQPDSPQPDRDVYGRLLSYVDTANNNGYIDVGEQMLRRGSARVHDSHPAVRRAQRYRQASDDAPGRPRPVGPLLSCPQLRDHETAQKRRRNR